MHVDLKKFSFIIDKPLYITIKNNNVECFHEMLGDSDLLDYFAHPKSYLFNDFILHDYPPLISVVAFLGAAKIVDYLLIHSLSPEINDNGGKSITHFASAGGNLQIMLRLYEYGFNLEEQDHRVFIILFI